MKAIKSLMVAALVVGTIFAVPNAANAAPRHSDTTAVTYDGSGKQGKPEGRRGDNRGLAKTPRVRSSSDCPVGLTCGVIEAAYALTDPTDFESYGNFDLANRPSADLPINGITIHTTEGDLDRVLELYANPASAVSSNIVIPGDGESAYDVITTVPLPNVAWTDGNWGYNTSHVSYEIVGYSAIGISARQLAVAARLAAFHGRMYGFPADAKHVVGHSAVPASTTSAIPTMHTDPGVLFNWEKFFRMTGHPIGRYGSVHVGGLATVAPQWRYNVQEISGCSGSGEVCVTTSPQKTNFVYLRTEPSASAPLISNPVTGAGSTDIGNNAGRAYYGQTFAVTAIQGDWTQLLFNGQLGWVYNPADCRKSLVPANGTKVTLKAGLSSAPVYGRSIPERSDFPPELTENPLVPSYSIPTQTPLPYTVLPGQTYAAIAVPVRASHYYTWSIGNELPKLVVYGQTWYVRFQFGDRAGYLRLSDVDLT